MKPSPRHLKLLGLTLLTAAALWAHAQAPAAPLRWLDLMSRTWTDVPDPGPGGCRGDDEAWTL